IPPPPNDLPVLRPAPTMRLPKPRAPPLPRLFHTTVPLPSRHPAPPNHYETLSVAASATAAELKTYVPFAPAQKRKQQLTPKTSQFYALSRKHHPDLHPGDAGATARFARISAAY